MGAPNGTHVAPAEIAVGMRLWCSRFAEVDEWIEVLHAGRRRFFARASDGSEDVWDRDEYEWTLLPPASDEPEDLGYVLGWAALGVMLGDDDLCESARAIGAAILGADEMRSLREVARHLACGVASDADMRLLGLQDVVIDWLTSDYGGVS